MRLTFRQAIELTSTVGSNASYEDDALEMLWFAAASLPRLSQIVEIGCEYGRSSSLLLQLARERGYQGPHFVDPFLTYSGYSATAFIQVMIKIKHHFHLHVMTTREAYPSLPLLINLLHIDGDHTSQGLQIDCDLLLPRIISGGYAVFHDYGEIGLPEVKPVVDRNTRTWKKIGTKGTCHVVRKP